MQMRCAVRILILAAGLLLPLLTFAQGFVNLDFESANLSSYSPGPVPTVDAIPGWTALRDNSPQETIAYNVGGLIEIVAATTIQGDYYIHLQGQRGLTVSIGQTGTIPDTSQSLVFWGNVNLASISFNGQELSLVVLGQTPGYSIYGADIAGFAGKTGPLLLSATGTAFADIDNLAFSTSPIPEPSGLTLAGLALVALRFWRWRKPMQ